MKTSLKVPLEPRCQCIFTALALLRAEPEFECSFNRAQHCVYGGSAVHVDYDSNRNRFLRALPLQPGFFLIAYRYLMGNF